VMNCGKSYNPLHNLHVIETTQDVEQKDLQSEARRDRI
jgi:hypothetical protein